MIYLLKGWEMQPGCELIFDPDNPEWDESVTRSKKIKILLKEKTYSQEYFSTTGFSLAEIYHLINNTIFSAACDLHYKTLPLKISIIGFDFYPDTNTVVILMKNL